VPPDLVTAIHRGIDRNLQEGQDDRLNFINFEQKVILKILAIPVALPVQKRSLREPDNQLAFKKIIIAGPSG
jgi:hypothetical protein